jgi:hypothetical protein
LKKKQGNSPEDLLHARQGLSTRRIFSIPGTTGMPLQALLIPPQLQNVNHTGRNKVKLHLPDPAVPGKRQAISARDN